MASIGGTSCTFLHTADGRPPAVLREEVELYRIAGVNGYGAHALGLAGGEFRLAAVLYTNAAGAATWEATLQAKQGTVVAIVDDMGRSHTYCLLLRVGNARITAARNAAGTITVRAEMEIAGVKTGS